MHSIIAVVSFCILFQLNSYVNGGNRHHSNIDPDGLWPRYGNTRENQQLSHSKLNKHNIKKRNRMSECTYVSHGSFAYYGYPIVDNNEIAYIVDTSGYVFAVDLDTCDEIWRISIADTLGYDKPIIARNAPTLYDDILLFGAPNGRYQMEDLYPINEPCWAIGLNKYDGSLEYAIDLNFIDLDNDGQNDLTELQSLACHAHGFMVDKDNKYAYGGLASAANFIDIPNPDHAFMGRMYKINLQTKQIENVFFTFPDNGGNIENRYTGASMWNFPALIDDYVVFGTGNLYSYPDYIGDCLNNSDSDPSLIPSNNYPFNLCGDDRSDNKFWRCLEDNIYPDSLITLNVNDFSIKSVIRTMGVDAYNLECKIPGMGSGVGDCPIVDGPDADIAAIATYKNKKGELIGVTTTKAGIFLVVNIETGKVLISKQNGLGKFNNWMWSSAVDPKSEIAISSFVGSVDGKLILPNDDIICGTGIASAIDLKTGKTKWIFVVPYGRIVSKNPNACDEFPSVEEYVDEPAHGRCTIDPFGNRQIDDSNAKIRIPNEMSKQLPVNSIDRALIIGPVTISNGLVYIPIITGDVYVLKLNNGKFVTRFECPEVEYGGQYNRAGIQGGVTVVNKRVIFYCGAWVFQLNAPQNGNILKSINFGDTTTKRSKSKSKSGSK